MDMPYAIISIVCVVFITVGTLYTVWKALDEQDGPTYHDGYGDDD